MKFPRITTDFMLWESSRPSQVPVQDLMTDFGLATTTFSMCKSGIHIGKGGKLDYNYFLTSFVFAYRI
jgi:hypothetical protein